MITDEKMADAAARMEDTRRADYATSAQFDVACRRIVIGLNTGAELAIPADLMQGLRGAEPEDLAEIEITASGLGLHWPRLDADLSVQGLMAGSFGSPRWIAELGERHAA